MFLTGSVTPTGSRSSSPQQHLPLARHMLTTATNTAETLQSLFNREHLALFLQRAKEISIFHQNSGDAAGSQSIQQQQQPSPSSVSSSSSSTNNNNGNNRQSVFRSFAFKCPLCSLVYRTQAFLNEHMRKEHSILI